MNRHLVRGLLALYPRAWRDRYGAEVVCLTDELIGAGETTPLRGALNLMAGAVVERGRPPAGSWRPALAVAAAAIVAVAASLVTTTHARPEPTPASLTSARCVVRTGSPEFSFVPAGVKPGQISRAFVPVGAAEPGRPRRANVPPKGESGPCVLVPELCRAGAGKLHRPNVPVPVRPGQCVITAPGLCQIAPAAALPQARAVKPGRPAVSICPALRRSS
jgi:hypothetical protein